MASLKFYKDLEQTGSALKNGECFVTLQHLLNLMWDERGGGNIPELRHGEMFLVEIMDYVNQRVMTLYSQETISPIKQFTKDVLFNFDQVRPILKLKDIPAALVWCDVPIPESIFKQGQATLPQQLAVSEPEQSQQDEEAAEPTDTKHKYDQWQEAVNSEYLKNKLQSHLAICARLAKSLGTPPETLRRRTKNPKNLKL